MPVGATEPGSSDSSPGNDDGAPTEIAEVTGEDEDVPGTTGSSSTGETDAGSTSEIVEYCGDGVVDDGEGCDLGEANSDLGYCTESCALNVCGDGLLFEGVELCDEGVGNSDLYGSNCGSHCAPSERCGDGFLQADAGEECDQGPGNGTDDVDDQGLKCSPVCRLVAYRGFITEATFTGNLDGLSGADDKCAAAADAAGLANPAGFRAFLSGDDVSANQRFADRIGDPTPYLLIGGQRFADSYDDLVLHGPGDGGISRTETGEQILYALVATNTRPDGEVYAAEESCVSWQSANKNLPGRIGYNAMAPDDANWSDWKSLGWWAASADVRTCDSMYFHLYCLE